MPRPRTGWCARPARRWRPSRRARSRGRSWRRRCPARPSPGHDPAALELAEHERPDALRVTGGVEGGLVHEDEREGAAEAGSASRALASRVRSGWLASSSVMTSVSLLAVIRPGMPPGKSSSPEEARLSSSSSSELAGVGQVAVVAEGDRRGGRGPERRLRVLPDRGAGGGVAGVPDREVRAAEGLERRLVEDLRDQPHVLVDHDPAAVARGDAGRLLPAVLQGVEAEVRELRDLLARRPDPEDAARVLGTVLVREKFVSEPTVTASHSPSLGDRSPRAGARPSVRPRAPRRRPSGEQRPRPPHRSTPSRGCGRR